MKRTLLTVTATAALLLGPALSSAQAWEGPTNSDAPRVTVPPQSCSGSKTSTVKVVRKHGKVVKAYASVVRKNACSTTRTAS